MAVGAVVHAFNPSGGGRRIPVSSGQVHRETLS